MPYSAIQRLGARPINDYQTASYAVRASRARIGGRLLPVKDLQAVRDMMIRAYWPMVSLEGRGSDEEPQHPIGYGPELLYIKQAKSSEDDPTRCIRSFYSDEEIVKHFYRLHVNTCM